MCHDFIDNHNRDDIRTTDNANEKRRSSSWCTALHTPPKVSISEHTRISDIIPRMVDTLLAAGVDVGHISSCLGDKPLRTLWISPTTRIFTDLVPTAKDLKFHAVVCVSASEAVGHEDRASYTYMQGCADDEEAWAPRGFTPAVFWAYFKEILSTEPENCLLKIKDIVAKDTHVNVEKMARVLEREEVSCGSNDTFPSSSQYFDMIDTTNIGVGSRRAARPPDVFEAFDAVINVTPESYSYKDSKPFPYLQLPVQEGKKDKSVLEALLPTALKFGYEQLSQQRRLLIHCAQGKDRSVAVAVALLVAFFKDDGSRDFAPCTFFKTCKWNTDDLSKHWETVGVNKLLISRCLHRVMVSRCVASPSRHTINKLHRFFMRQ